MNRANVHYHIANQIANSSGEVAGQIFEQEVRITAAQLKALATTQITLVTAPGANKVLEFVSAVLWKEAGTAYAEPSAPDDMRVEYSGGQDVSADIDATNFLDQTVVEMRTIRTNLAATVDMYALRNQALQLINTGGNYTGGDGALIVKTAYRVHDISANV